MVEMHLGRLLRLISRMCMKYLENCNRMINIGIIIVSKNANIKQNAYILLVLLIK